ncbi:HAD hydrolase-like protein [Sneathiella sp. P13V-1]|uniref:HAD family hydrolase n=1 Tax=Sneathiella sp. P13V-1 TaxID=2697366 RepID=UPI00187B2241|nr:HAD family hydrolase [Sneathiella sp. P13V-1]MBE7638556.1 HAD hydrolase-like protein [Sneathiella sp. P13V-1]
MPISTIAFDADDTLWENEEFFRLTEERFRDLLTEHVDREDIAKDLLETEKRNLRYYGYGIKGFTLSMIETAIEVTGGKIPATIIQEILHAGREMFDHPAVPLSGVRETLQTLHGNYRIVLITKGDLFDQERKLAQSGLGDFFDAVEIVSEKEADTYHRIFDQYGDGPARSTMVGNSMKSDVVPAIEAGAFGVFIPSQITWAMEEAAPPDGHERFHQLSNITQLPDLIEQITSA